MDTENRAPEENTEILPDEDRAPEPQKLEFVELSNRRLALMADVVAHRDPHCKHCGPDAHVTFVEKGQRIRMVCGCADSRYLRAKRQEAIEAARAQATKVAPLPPRASDREKAERRVKSHQAALDSLTKELAEREEAFKAGNAGLEESAKRYLVAIQDHASELTWLREKVAAGQAAIVEAEARVIELQQQLTAQKQDIVRAEDARVLAETMVEDSRREMNRRHVEFEKSTRRLRKDIAKAQGRLTRARVYNGLDVETAPVAEGI